MRRSWAWWLTTASLTTNTSLIATPGLSTPSSTFTGQGNSTSTRTCASSLSRSKPNPYQKIKHYMGTLIGLQQFKFWYNLVTLKLRNEWLLIINDGKAIIPAGNLGSHNSDDHFKSTLYLPCHGNDGSWGLVGFARTTLLITKWRTASNFCN